MTPRIEPGDQPMEESDLVKPVLFCVYIFGAKENGARVGWGRSVWLGYKHVYLM